MSIKNNGPAFSCDRIGADEVVSSTGLSKREYFAGLAMQAHCRVTERYFIDSDEKSWEEEVAKASYRMADAMIKAGEEE